MNSLSHRSIDRRSTPRGARTAVRRSSAEPKLDEPGRGRHSLVSWSFDPVFRRSAVGGRPSVLTLAALLLLLTALPVRAQILPSFGGDRTGQSGFQFLKVPVDARAAALGETVVANAADASALYWNPALAVQSRAHHLAFSHTRYFSDISMEYAAGIVHVSRLNLSVGGSVQALNSGDMAVTTEFEPTGTGETFRFVDLAAGLTLSQSLTDLFSYGVTGKYIRESAAGVSTSTALFDLGFFYRVGDTGAQMAVAIRNFGLNAAPEGALSRTVLDQTQPVVEEDFESITPPTMFLFGLTYDVLPQEARDRLQVSGQLTNRNDNAETFNVGAEYVWNGAVALRSGYRFGIDEYTLPSVGLGLYVPYVGRDLRFDYAFSRRERLGSVHHFGLDLSL